MEGLGEAAHQEHGQNAGADQHQAGGQQEVGGKPPHKVVQHPARRADKNVAFGDIALEDGPGRHIEFLVKGALHPAQLVVDAVLFFLRRPGHIFQHLIGDLLPGQMVAVGGQHHLALGVGEKEVDVGAFADQVQLIQGAVHLFPAGDVIPEIAHRPVGQLSHIVQGIKPLLGKVAAEQHQLGQAHHRYRQNQQGGHDGKEGHRYAFSHY